ncbi:MAG: RodZ domain-containing protein [Anaerolineales bacterium]
MATIGEQLRQAREEKGLSIQDIEKATHIRHAFVLALEEDRLQDLPDPTYVRGFVRNYARVLGLDPEPLVEAFARAAGTPSLAVPTILDEPLLSQGRKAARRRIMISLVVLLVLAAGWLSYLYFYRQQTPWPLNRLGVSAWGATPTPAITAPPEPAPTDTPLPTATPVPVTATPTRPVPTPTRTATPFGTLPQTAQATIGAAPTQTLAAGEALPADTEGLPTPGDLTPTAATTTIPEGEGVTVRLVASGYTWVSVTVDGAEAFVGYLNTDDERSWTGAQAVELTIGNAAAVSVEVNGVTVGTLGGEGQVANVRYTLDNLPQ